MYRNSGKQHNKILLWGAPVSLWSGRVRAYLIKKGLAYQEIYPANARFSEEILPLIGYFAVPATELEDGTVIQDGTDTMEYLEARYPDQPMIPRTPVQKAVAWLIEFFGCDLFFIPAMHYRWNFPEQRDYLNAEFARGLSLHKDPEGQLADLAPVQAFFAEFPKVMGINPNTMPAIEASHVECLELLNNHFHHHPYVLGGHPTIADFGLIGPLYAHLGRDPVPCELMKRVAPHVYRWTERMFEPGIIDGEFIDTPPSLADDDSIPDTLIPFVEYLFRDCGAQVTGTIETFNNWVRTESPQAGTLVQKDPEGPVGAHPQLGNFEFELQGTTIKTEAFANVVHHFQRVLDVVDGLDEESRARFDELISQTGGEQMMATRLTHRIKAEYYKLLLV